jgi:predicted site-specific integrase-resolvase
MSAEAKEIETMTAKEACETLKISLMTLRRRMAAGEITPLPKNPAQKRAYRLFFRKEDVERLRQA